MFVNRFLKLRLIKLIFIFSNAIKIIVEQNHDDRKTRPWKNVGEIINKTRGLRTLIRHKN